MKGDKVTFEQLKLALISYLIKQHNFQSNIRSWTRSNFVSAAKVFSKILRNRNNHTNNSGQLIDNYISNSTLERIFKYGYELPNPIDKRRLNTLNKLAVCLGYESFSDYSFILKNDLDVDFEQLILDANKAEFQMYKNMPEVNFEILLPYFIKDAPAYNQIYKLVSRLAKKEVSLNDDKNPSYYEILEVEVLKKQADSIRIKAKECWYLKWFNKNIDTKYYNESNTQLYILDKTDKGWKIRINHYPYNFDD